MKYPSRNSRSDDSMYKVILFLTIASMAGCSKCKEGFSHSCPEVGHGPCYICDDPNYIKYGRKDIIPPKMFKPRK